MMSKLIGVHSLDSLNRPNSLGANSTTPTKSLVVTSQSFTFRNSFEETFLGWKTKVSFQTGFLPAQLLVLVCLVTPSRLIYTYGSISPTASVFLQREAFSIVIWKIQANYREQTISIDKLPEASSTMAPLCMYTVYIVTKCLVLGILTRGRNFIWPYTTLPLQVLKGQTQTQSVWWSQYAKTKLQLGFDTLPITETTDFWTPTFNSAVFSLLESPLACQRSTAKTLTSRTPWFMILVYPTRSHDRLIHVKQDQAASGFFSSVLTLALALVTLTLRCWALFTIRALVLADTVWAISAQKVLLFMSKMSKSLTPLTTNFLRPLGRWNLVLLSEPQPILGMGLLPLNLLLTLLSIPLGLLQAVERAPWQQSDSNLMNLALYFLTIRFLSRGEELTIGY